MQVAARCGGDGYGGCLVVRAMVGVVVVMACVNGEVVMFRCGLLTSR